MFIVKFVLCRIMSFFKNFGFANFNISMSEYVVIIRCPYLKQSNISKSYKKRKNNSIFIVFSFFLISLYFHIIR